ncbi:MAG: hypothetical protein ACOX2M_08235 [Fastidiosipilaceae bacterium]
MKSRKCEPSNLTDRTDGRLPIYATLRDAHDTEQYSFHMPGHSAGHGFSAEFQEWLPRLDTTELPTTGDLNEPDGAVADSQRMAAAYFGAAETIFLTGGATSGIQAMLLGVVGMGGKVLIDPMSHRAVLNAAALWQIETVMIAPTLQSDPEFSPAANHFSSAYPSSGDPSSLIDHFDHSLSTNFSYETDDRSGGAGPACPDWYDPLPHVTACDLNDSLNRHQDASAVLITSPDYYGNTADLAALNKVCLDHNVPLLVDEAHGAHFACDPSIFPRTALAAGCASCVQSTHKTLAALTPTALLHVGQKAPFEARTLMAALRLIRTSSPPLAMAASIEYAVDDLRSRGATLFQAIHTELKLLSGRLRHPYRISPVTSASTRARRDPTRLVIDTSEVAPAMAVAEELVKRGIVIEFADLMRLILVPGIGLPISSWPALASELNRIGDEWRTKSPDMGPTRRLDSLLTAAYRRDDRAPNPALTAARFRHAPKGENLEVVEIPLEEADGRTLVESITPYPPGIPLVWPGERLNAGLISLLRELWSNGIRCQGLESRSGQLFAHVLREDHVFYPPLNHV